MKIYKYIILFVTAMALLCIASCNDDDTIVVFDEEESYPPSSNDNGMINNMISPLEYSMSFPYELKNKLGYKETEYYPLEGNGMVTLKHRIYPFYVYEGSNNNGDYYIVQSEVVVENDSMYKGVDTYKYVDKDKESKCDITITGYYLKDIKTSYELIDKDNNAVGSFPLGHSPTPLTTLGSSTYKSGFSFSIGGKIRVGISPKDSSRIGIVNYSPIKFDVMYNNVVKRNKEDMEVINSSTQKSPIYHFNITRSPADNAGEGAYTPQAPPLIAITTNQQSEEWIWHVPSTLDSQGDDINFKIRQKVELIYGSAQSQFSLKTLGLRRHLSENTYTVTKESIFEITPPCRNPMGNVRIVNKNKNMYIKDVRIIKEGAVYPSALSKGSIAYKGEFERAVDIGRYKVSFSMGRKGNDVKTYTTDGYITVSKDKTLVLYSDFDFEIE